MSKQKFYHWLFWPLLLLTVATLIWMCTKNSVYFSAVFNIYLSSFCSIDYLWISILYAKPSLKAFYED